MAAAVAVDSRPRLRLRQHLDRRLRRRPRWGRRRRLRPRQRRPQRLRRRRLLHGHANDGPSAYGDDGSDGHANDGPSACGDDGSDGHANDGPSACGDDSSDGHANSRARCYRGRRRRVASVGEHRDHHRGLGFGRGRWPILPQIEEAIGVGTPEIVKDRGLV